MFRCGQPKFWVGVRSPQRFNYRFLACDKSAYIDCIVCASVREVVDKAIHCSRSTVKLHALLHTLSFPDGDEIFADTDSNETIQLPPLPPQSHHAAAIDYSMSGPDLLDEV